VNRSIAYEASERMKKPTPRDIIVIPAFFWLSSIIEATIPPEQREF
jgi:hypothetical protein